MAGLTRSNEKIQMSALRVSALWLAVILVELGAVTAEPPGPSKCCPGEARWYPDTKNCTDGTRMRLFCPSGFYKFQPSVDTFETMSNVLVNGSIWLHFENNRNDPNYQISPDNYCLANTTELNETIALICFDKDVPMESHHSNASDHPIFFGTSCIISSVFLLITLLIYLNFKELSNIQDKAVVSMVGSFMVAFFINGLQQFRLSIIIKNNLSCLLTALIMYYFYMSAFFWLNIISLNIWRSVWFPKFKLEKKDLFAIYSVIGWGIPLCFLMVSIMSHHIEGYHLKPGFGEISCWFYKTQAFWVYFYGPILMLLIMNLTYLGLTSFRLWHQYRNVECCKMKVLRFKCMMFLKLALLMGFTWIFEVWSFSVEDATSHFWMLADVLNVLQGVVMFLLLVVMRHKVRKLLAENGFLGLSFPKSWSAYADQEDCDVVGPEELELSESS